jgi:endonuclease YncB( thermonuclease family)
VRLDPADVSRRWRHGMAGRHEVADAGDRRAGDGQQGGMERVKAQASLQRLAELMAPGYSIKGSGRSDRFGRALVDVALKDGRDAGKLLIAEGLAQPWPNSGNVWCGR